MQQVWQEISTLEQLNALDQDSIVQGYLDGLHGVANHMRTDQAYWHGHGNAHSDRSGAPTIAQQQLAREYVKSLHVEGA